MKMINRTNNLDWEKDWEKDSYCSLTEFEYDYPREHIIQTRDKSPVKRVTNTKKWIQTNHLTISQLIGVCVIGVSMYALIFIEYNLYIFSNLLIAILTGLFLVIWTQLQKKNRMSTTPP